MKRQSCISLLTMIVFLLATSTQGLQAADLTAITQAQLGTANPLHTLSAAELHQSIQNSQKQVTAAKKSIQDFLASPAVTSTIQSIGSNPERVKSQVALLSDHELINLNQQIMQLNLQNEAASGWKGTKWVVGGVIILVAVLLLVSTIEDASNV